MLILRGNNGIKLLNKVLKFNYSSCSISINNDEVLTNDSISQTRVASARDISRYQQFVNLPSTRLTESYNVSSVNASKLVIDQDSKDNQIIHEVLKLSESYDFKNLCHVLYAWSESNLSHMIKVLGRQQISYYLKLIIFNYKKELINHYKISPVLKSLNREKLNNKLDHENKSISEIHREIRDMVRNIYNRLAYDTHDHSTHLYDKSKVFKVPINLVPSDYENLIEFELNNFKPDLSSKWMKKFQLQFKEDWINQMSSKLWELLIRIENKGDYKLWDIKPSEISNLKIKNKFCHFKNSPVDINNIPNKADLSLEFHSAIVQYLGYSKQYKNLFKYIEIIWGIDSNGNQAGPLVDSNDKLYPDMNLLMSIFQSLIYNLEFYQSLNYINQFQNVYDLSPSVSEQCKLWEQIFKWANIKTHFIESKALRWYCKETGVDLMNNQLKIEDVQNNVNFDYEGFLQVLNGLKTERREIFNQCWDLITSNDEFPFSSYIYKTYIDYLKEFELEEVKDDVYYDLLSNLFIKYHQYHIDSKSFTFKSSNKVDLQIQTVYDEVLKDLIEIKFKQFKFGQIIPLINEWSLNDEMIKDLKNWIQDNQLIKTYKLQLEQKRQEFLNSLQKYNDDDTDDFNDNDNGKLLNLI